MRWAISTGLGLKWTKIAASQYKKYHQSLGDEANNMVGSLNYLCHRSKKMHYTEKKKTFHWHLAYSAWKNTNQDFLRSTGLDKERNRAHQVDGSICMFCSQLIWKYALYRLMTCRRLQTSLKKLWRKNDFLQHASKTHPNTNISEKSEANSTNKIPNDSL